MADDPSNGSAIATIDNLVQATNRHDLDGVVACFTENYTNETPAHPSRGFEGREQVRRNWTQIFGSVPDVRVEVLRSAASGNTVWTEWEMSGTRLDDAGFLMRGVILFGVAEKGIEWARFYVEPVEAQSGDADRAVAAVVKPEG
jgi:limonene-1,2-epoxide hydrolase